MEVLAGVVIIRVAVPSTFPRISRLVLLGIVDAEVVSFEPADLKVRTRNSTWEVAEVVVGDDSVRRVRRACFDVVKPIAPGEVGSDPVKNFCINGTMTG